MHTFFALVNTSSNGIIRVEIQAPNQYAATQMLKAQYGNQLLSEASHKPR